MFDYQFGFDPTTAAAGQIQMIQLARRRPALDAPAATSSPAFDTCNFFEPSIGRCVEDGVGGARSDLSPAPSVDIANGAPTGGAATNRIVISWVDGRDGLNREHVMFSQSTNGGASWQTPSQLESRPDRGYYSAPAISPERDRRLGRLQRVHTPFRESAEGPGNDRPARGRGAARNWPAGGVRGAFSEVHRGATGDARGSSQNDLAAEFLGDYVYAAATNDYGMSVWNDVRNAQNCPAVDEYRQELHEEAVATGQRTAEPEEPRGAEDHFTEPDAGRGGARHRPSSRSALTRRRSGTPTSSAFRSQTRLRSSGPFCLGGGRSAAPYGSARPCAESSPPFPSP